MVGLQHFQIVFCNAAIPQLLAGVVKQGGEYLFAPVRGNHAGTGIEHHALTVVHAAGIEDKGNRLALEESAKGQGKIHSAGGQIILHLLWCKTDGLLVVRKCQIETIGQLLDACFL